MKNLTLKNLKRNIRTLTLCYVIAAVIIIFVGVMMSLALSELLYAGIFALGTVTYSVIFLPFIIYFVRIKKRFEELMQTEEPQRGILLGFKRSFFMGTFFGYMEIDGETYRTHSIYISGYRNVNEAFSLINKEVTYILDDDKIYLIG